ncbi:MAG: ABC transporter permease [Actinobacteria bacterium]|nr:ABC transporter permease [Actinomycetota bacterium]
MRDRLAGISLLPLSSWLVAFFLVPLGMICAISLATTDLVGTPIFALEFSNYSALLDPLYVPVVIRTLAYAGAATALCILLGYPAAYTVARLGGRHRHAIILLIALPWFVDYLIRIYAWLAILGGNGLLNNVLHQLGLTNAAGLSFVGHSYTVILGLTYSYLPFMILTIYVAVDQMDPRVIEAGKDLYGGPWSTFFYVTLPTTLQGIVAGSLLVFLPALGDFATVQFLGGANQTMIGNLIVNDFSTVGNAPQAAAWTVVIIGSMVMVLVMASLVARIRRRGATHRIGSDVVLGGTG